MTALVLVLAAFAVNSQEAVRLGVHISEEQLADFDLVATPDGSGFPAGSGNARDGKAVYETRCAACHGLQGEGNAGNFPLVGGDMRSEESPLRTVGSYWPWASTIFDFVRRAMPADAPKSLSDAEVYQVTAYLLYLNGIIEEDTVLDAESINNIRMPNADGFIDRSHVQ